MSKPDETRRQMAYELLNHLDDGGIPGTALRSEGREIWIHTTGQVEGWLRTWLEREEITSVSDSEQIAELTDELTQARDELSETKGAVRRLRARVAELEAWASYPDALMARAGQLRGAAAGHDHAMEIDRLADGE